MKIFITGASGFIGGAIASQLSQSHQVLGMARSDHSAQKIRALGATPVLCSLDDIAPNHLAGVEVVIHCAAFVEPWGTRAEFADANVAGTQRVLAAARDAGVARFIHIGTEAALFRGQDMTDIDETYPYPDRTPFLYSETKRDAEKLVLAANEDGQFTTLSIRPRLVWGPGDTTILPNVVEMVDRGAFRWIDGGRLLTSSTHIANLVAGVELALTRGRGAEAYFITDGPPHTMRDFLSRLLATAGRDPGSKSVPAWLLRTAAWSIETLWKTFGIRKKPPVTRFSAAIMSRNCTIRIDKAEKELGYRPVITVDEGMKELQAMASA
jgi:nucleoside-diphosphate-sugar epimerase